MAQEDPGGHAPGEGAVAVVPSRSEAALDRDETGPTLAQGVELIGEYEGSGFKEPPSLVRRPDGQVIQLPPLLYSLATKADGRRSYGDIAAQLTAEIHRDIDAEQVRFLVDEKLRPLGVLAQADGSSPPTSKPDPLLGLKFRIGVVSEAVSQRLGTAFKPLFLPPVVVVVLAVFVVADGWLFFSHGVAPAIRESIYQPGVFLAILAAVALSAAFHEVGHAAGCRYGGGHPGKMGCGLYLAWPAFYTDVTDAYRLGRRARLRTDLGGVYFNVVVVVATIGAYLLSGFEPLLLLVVIQHFEIAHQLLPLVRLDGYYIVADLTGVPDLFSRIGPILRSMVPGRVPDEQVTVLKRWVRVAVTAWVLVVVPLLAFELVVLLIHLPRMLATAWDSAGNQMDRVGDSFGAGNPLGGISAGLQLAVLAIPVVGILLVLARSARQLARSTWRRTEGRPAARTLSVAAGGVVVVLLALAWLPGRNYEPIRPGERGTFTEGVGAVRTLPGGSGPRYSQIAASQRGELVEDADTSSGDATPAPVNPSATGQPPTGGADAGGPTAVTVPAPANSALTAGGATGRSGSGPPGAPAQPGSDADATDATDPPEPDATTPTTVAQPTTTTSEATGTVGSTNTGSTTTSSTTTTNP